MAASASSRVVKRTVPKPLGGWVLVVGVRVVGGGWFQVPGSAALAQRRRRRSGRLLQPLPPPPIARAPTCSSPRGPSLCPRAPPSTPGRCPSAAARCTTRAGCAPPPGWGGGSVRVGFSSGPAGLRQDLRHCCSSPPPTPRRRHAARSPPPCSAPPPHLQAAGLARLCSLAAAPARKPPAAPHPSPAAHAGVGVRRRVHGGRARVVATGAGRRVVPVPRGGVEVARRRRAGVAGPPPAAAAAERAAAARRRAGHRCAAAPRRPAGRSLFSKWVGRKK
jgi:hypothetical protein